MTPEDIDRLSDDELREIIPICHALSLGSPVNPEAYFVLKLAAQEELLIRADQRTRKERIA